MNGGKCMSLTKDDGLFSCECPAGYRGERCDRTNMTINPINRVEIVTPLSIMAWTSSQIPLLSERSTTTVVATSTFFDAPSSITATTETFRTDDNET